MGYLHIAQALTDHISLDGNFPLPGTLRTAGINEHIHHEVGTVPFNLPAKQLGIIRASHFPHPGRNDSPPVGIHFCHFISHNQRFFQCFCENCNISLYSAVFIKIEKFIFFSGFLRIFILVIFLYRILKNPFCKVETAVTVQFPAHMIIDALTVQFCQIGSAEIQLHIRVHFLQSFRCNHFYCLLFGLLLCLLFHRLLLVHVLHIGHIDCQLLQITLKSILIHFLGQKILPGIFCQFFDGHCQNFFQIPILFFKFGVHHLVVQLVNLLNQFPAVSRLGTLIDQVHPSSGLGVHPVTALQSLSQQRILQFPPGGSRHFLKSVVNYRLKSFLADGFHPWTLCTDSFAHRFFHTQLGNTHKRPFLCVEKNLLHQIEPQCLFIVILGKCPLLHTVIQSNLFCPEKCLHIWLHIQSVVPADSPEQILNPVF